MITKVKNTVSWTCVISDLKREEIVGTCHKKELQKTKTKIIKDTKSNLKKALNYMLNGKVMVIHLIVGLIKKA